MKLSDQFQRYLATSRLTESSVNIKRRAVEYFIDLHGDIDPNEVCFAHAEDYQNGLCHRKLKPVSANIYVQNIKPFFTWLSRRKIIGDNPFERIHLLQEDEKFCEPFAALEIENMLTVADLRMQVAVLIMLVSGIRRGELLNITVKDVFFDKSCILIQPKDNTETTWKWTVKNHLSAFVPLPEEINLPGGAVNIHNLVVRLIEHCPANQPYFLLKPSHYARNMELLRLGKLSCDRRGCPWPSFSRDFRSLVKRAMVGKSRTPHNFRSSLATILAESNVPLTKTQKILRHKSPQTTAAYYIKHDQQQIIEETNKITKKYYMTNVP